MVLAGSRPPSSPPSCFGAQEIYPEEFETATIVYTADIQDTLLGWINDVLEYIQDPDTFVFGITDAIGNFILDSLLEPLRKLLVESPWFIVLGGLTAIAFVLSGLRPAVTAFLMLATIGIIGMWEPAMDTASQVLVATAIAVAIGIALGHLGGREPAGGEDLPAGPRHAADAPAARLHHPVHLPDAGVARAGRGRLGSVRDPGDHQAGDLGAPGRPHARPSRRLRRSARRARRSCGR